MADNKPVSNAPTDDNPTLYPRSINKTGDIITPVVALDWGGSGAESFTLPDFATQTTLAAILSSLSASSVLPTTPTHTRPTVGDATSTTVLAANANRKRATIQNNTAQTYWLKEGATAVVDQGFPLRPNQYYQVQSTAAINAIKSSGGNLELDVLECV